MGFLRDERGAERLSGFWGWALTATLAFMKLGPGRSMAGLGRLVGGVDIDES